MTAYGRGRSDLGKTHIQCPEYPTQSLCGSQGMLRLYKFDAQGREFVECKRCASCFDRRTAKAKASSPIS